MVQAHGRRLGQDHDHSGPGEGGTTLSPDRLEHDGVINVAERSSGAGTDANPWTGFESITDDLPTATWDATFSASGTGPYGILYWPAGIYEVSSLWTLDKFSNLTWITEGWNPSEIGDIADETEHEGETVIRSVTSSGEAIKLPQDANNRATVALNIFGGLTVKQSTENMTADGGNVIDLSGWHLGNIDQLSVASVDSGNGHRPDTGIELVANSGTNIKRIGSLRVDRFDDIGVNIQSDHLAINTLVVHDVADGSNTGIGLNWSVASTNNTALRQAQFFTCDIGMSWTGGGFIQEILFENCTTTIESGKDVTETPVIGRVKLSSSSYDGALSSGRAVVLSGPWQNKFLHYGRGAYHHELFESQDAFATNTSGTGSLTFGDFGYRLRPGGTANSIAAAGLFRKLSRVTMTWGSPRQFQAQFDLDQLGEIAMIGMGDMRDGDAADRYVGFIMEGGDIKGICGDGSSTSKTVLVSGASTGLHDVYCEHDPGNEARFWVDKADIYDNPDGTISSNLPSGTTAADMMWSAAVENPDGVDFTHELHEVRFRQFP